MWISLRHCLVFESRGGEVESGASLLPRRHHRHGVALPAAVSHDQVARRARPDSVACPRRNLVHVTGIRRDGSPDAFLSFVPRCAKAWLMSRASVFVLLTSGKGNPSNAEDLSSPSTA